MYGEFQLASQSKEAAYYAKVCMDVEYTPIQGQFIIEFDPNLAKDWQISVKFGIEYAIGYTPEDKNTQGLYIKVLQILWHPIDTTNIILAFTSAYAFWKALNLDPPRKLEFDIKKGVFIFPKHSGVYRKPNKIETVSSTI